MIYNLCLTLRDTAHRNWNRFFTRQPIVRHVGARWWRFRVPGYGSVDWKGFFSVLAEAGYQGAMNIENEDPFYEPSYDQQGNFTENFKRGFRQAHEFLRTLAPV